MLEAKLLYHSLSAETRFDLPRLDDRGDSSNSRRDGSPDDSNASARLALPAPVPTPDGGAMVLWGAGDVHEDADANANADANAGRWTRDRGVVSERRSPPASVAPLGALQLRGPAKAVARAREAAVARGA